MKHVIKIVHYKQSEFFESTIHRVLEDAEKDGYEPIQVSGVPGDVPGGIRYILILFKKTKEEEINEKD